MSNVIWEVTRIMLADVGPKVAHALRTDPKVAELIEPAVLISANEEGGVASVVERLQVVEMLAGKEPTAGPPVTAPSPEDRPILAALLYKGQVACWRLPDPRISPESWPWTGPADDD
jgi:hypothetical protein